MEKLVTTQVKEEIAQTRPLEKKDDCGTPGSARTYSGNCSGWAALRREQQEQLQSNHHEKWAMMKES
jgi:hypothetical protein